MTGLSKLFTLDGIISALITVFCLMLAATIHEVAHGYVAYRCGDNTAKNAGRLSLDPLRHIDPFGSVVLPLIMVILGGPVFAFAKPVPYNPNNLRNRRRDEMLVALAGPFSNLLQAFVGACLLAAVWRLPAVIWNTEAVAVIVDVLTTYMYVNLMLLFFNLIPLPPLDGSHIIGWFLHGNALNTYYKIQRYSMPILIIVLYLLPDFLGIDPVGSYLSFTAGGLYNLFLHWPVGAL